MGIMHDIHSRLDGAWQAELAKVGVTLPMRRGKCACPFCGRDKGKGKGTFDLKDVMTGRYYANPCPCGQPGREYGDAIDLYLSATNGDMKSLCEIAGIDGGNIKSKPVERNDNTVMAAIHAREQLQKQQEDSNAFRAAMATLLGICAPGDAGYLAGKKFSTFWPLVTPGGFVHLPARGDAGDIVQKHFHLPIGSMLIPLSGESGKIQAAQIITPKGDKFNLTGGKKKGAFYIVNPDVWHPVAIVICEGFATAKSVAAMLPEMMCVAAIDAGNLVDVARIMRKRHPERLVIIAGDNDESGVGQSKAKEAAEAISGVALCTRKPGTDWSDVYMRVHDGDLNIADVRRLFMGVISEEFAAEIENHLL